MTVKAKWITYMVTIVGEEKTHFGLIFPSGKGASNLDGGKK